MFSDKDLDILDKDDWDEVRDLEDKEDKSSKQENNQKRFSSFFKKKSKNKYKTQDDIEQEKKNIINKAIILITVFGFMILIFIALVKTMQKQSEYRVKIDNLPKKELPIKLSNENDNLWKLEVNDKINSLDKKITQSYTEIKKLLKEESNQTIKAVNNLIEEKVTRKINNLQEQINEIKKERSEIKEIINNKLDAAQKKLKVYVLQKNLELRKDFLENNKNNKSLTSNKSEKLENKQNKNSLNQNAIVNNQTNNKSINNQKSKENIAANIDINKGKQIIQQIEKEVEDLDIENIPFDNTIQYNTKKEIKKEENIPYHLMTGFTKATLITGVAAPTFSNGVINPKPVLLSVDGREIIANNQEANLADCMLIGKATGNMNSSRAEILITRISCSIPTENPNVYKKIEATGNPIGWVIGEDGKYGLKGRLVDSAGKLIMRQLMIGFLQGVANAFTPAATFIPTQTAIQNQTLTSKDLARGAKAGIASGASNALNSLAEYYKKMLDGIYPYIDVMGGRKVTVLIRGFKDIKVTKYKKVNVTPEISDKEIDDEIEIDYDNF